MLYNVIMNDDNYVTITDENVAEINPTASSDMQQAFIDNYRQMQSENTAQIGEAAHALGSDLEAQYGGLHGPSEYMKSRYQTPQTESRLAALRTAAQLSALNQLMQNDQNRWKNRYNQAYRSAQKRARAKQNSGTTSPTTPANPADPANQEPEVEYKNTNVAPGSFGTNAPVEGFSDTSYADVDGHWHTIYTQGRRRIEYVDGQLVSDNTSAVESETPGGGGGGGSW